MDRPVIKSTLGLVTLSSIVVANMIGAGVFTTSGFALGNLGSPAYVLLAWFIGGLLALCGALSYGALTRTIPVSGGEYLYLSRIVHPLAGFIAGWISLLAGFTGAIAYAAITLEVYLLPPQSLPGNIVASVAILLAACLHGLRLRQGAIMQNITVVLKLILIGAFILFALFGTDMGNWQGTSGNQAVQGFSLTTFAVTLMWISFSYSGFNAAIYVASEVHEARILIPKALLIATLVTMFVYLLLNAIFVYAPDYESIANQKDIAAIAADFLGGEDLSRAVRILIAISLFTSVSAMVMVGPRVYARMAEDGLMPELLRFKGEVPTSAVFTQAFLAITVVWITGLRELLSYLGFTLGLSTAATVSTLFIIVNRDPGAARQMTGYPWAPAIFILFTLVFIGIAATRNPWEMVAAVLTIVSGIVIYFSVK